MIRMALATLALVWSVASAQTDAPTFSSTDPIERATHRRAIEAVIWGMPAVNAELMFQAMRDAKADFNQVVYWSRPVTWKNQTLTPNPDTIYLMPMYNTKDAGPIVLEIPPAGADESITGSVDDAWQTAIEDVGPAGVDKGKGGKYLILPPGYKEKVPEGYIPMPSATYAGYALLRSNLKSGSDADIAKAAAYGRRVKFYPLSAAASPPETRYVDAVEVLFDSTIPYDARFFETLDRFVQREPWLERDKVMINQLKSVGIEKGKPFSPDADTRKVLDGAAREARAYLDQQYQGIFVPPFNAGTHWALPAAPGVAEGIMSNFAAPGCIPGRRPRHRLFDGVLQRQAPGRRPVLPDDDRRQGGPATGRRRDLSPECAGERAGPAVLVRNRLRSRNACADPRLVVVQPLVAHAGPCEEC